MPDSEGQTGLLHALIVASGRYTDPTLGELRSPSRDAEQLAQVLKNPTIGGFGVQVLLDQPGHLLREEIEGFFANRRPDDLLVLYVSCHGVKDASGRLYFAASTTKLNRLASTGISADFVYEQVDRCRARKILLLLDCYSGAYLAGHRARAEQRLSGLSMGGDGRSSPRQLRWSTPSKSTLAKSRAQRFRQCSPPPWLRGCAREMPIATAMASSRSTTCMHMFTNGFARQTHIKPRRRSGAIFAAISSSPGTRTRLPLGQNPFRLSPSKLLRARIIATAIPFSGSFLDLCRPGIRYGVRPICG
jgi:Caspase domain